MAGLRETDPEVYAAIQGELRRQRETLELIASENIVSRAVLEAVGSVLTNKYAEGYPDHRYYGGCEHVDVVEELARERAKALFGAEYVNVQPHSGAQANMAVYYAALESGDRVLGMKLSDGGHLTHGSPVNFSGRNYTFYSYGVSPVTEELDYDEIRGLARQVSPRLIVAGASAYPRTIDYALLREIADEVGALLMVDMAHVAGLVAAGVHPSPVPYCDFVTTTTHKTLRGPRGGLILAKAEWGKKLDSAIFPGIQGGPLMHVIAGKAVCLKEAATPEFRRYQNQVVQNARALGQGLLERGYRLVTGGTDNHLLLWDVGVQGWTGREVSARLEEVGITTNKNTIPRETRSPQVTSGVRLGTPAVTTRGMGEPEMEQIARLMDEVLRQPDDATKKRVRSEVSELCRAFPVYEDLPDPVGVSG